MSNGTNGHSNEQTWTDPELPVQEVTQTLKDGTERTFEKRITPTINGMDLVKRCLTCETVQSAVDATGLPADIIVQRIENYGRKLKKQGYAFDAANTFKFFGEYKAAVSAGPRGGAKVMDLAGMAALLGLSKSEEASE